MQRINELKEKIQEIEETKYLDEEFELLAKTSYLPWKTQVLDIFSKLLDRDSTYFQEFSKLDSDM